MFCVVRESDHALLYYFGHCGEDHFEWDAHRVASEVADIFSYDMNPEERRDLIFDIETGHVVFYPSGGPPTCTLRLDIYEA